MIKGSAKVYIDGVEYTLSDNRAAIVLPHQIHYSSSDWNNKIYVMHISKQLLPAFEEQLNGNILENPIIDLDPSKNDICKGILNYIIERFRSFPPKGLEYRKYIDNSTAADIPFVKNLAQGYMSLILEKAEWKKKVETNIDSARKILEYCLNNYSNDISISKVSQAMGVAEATVTRVFSGVVKCPFRTYINNLRLEDVVGRLITTNQSISEISEKCGFETVRTFNRVFFSVYGVTPTEYRRRNNDGDVGIMTMEMN